MPACGALGFARGEIWQEHRNSGRERSGGYAAVFRQPFKERPRSAASALLLFRNPEQGSQSGQLALLPEAAAGLQGVGGGEAEGVAGLEEFSDGLFGERVDAATDGVGEP